MKDRLQPISEAFVYGSPEQILSFSYRRVAAAPRRAGKERKVPMGGRNGCKHRN
ncbi:MAG: hypothetical protein JAY97_06290 [Candidatus Thiodiazotropha sp. 'RUGA']|nr:hypothetical protein [Candidatus Thiodiazotropha sp. 'RUGA']